MERRIHAFVNPFSGVAGQSLQIWTQLKVLFSAAHVGIDETMTTHRGHAEEVCSTIDLETVKDGILVVSGDGLFHEVVNGLLHRQDWEIASKIPLGIIPAGSGNGLARSIQAVNPVQAALAIIKGKTNHLDTWSVIANKERRFSVLSIEWGTVASIDFDSERARILGAARFHLWAVLKLVNRQRYSAEFSILRGQEDPSDHPRLQQMQAALQQEQLLRKIETLNLKYSGSEASSSGSPTGSSPQSPRNTSSNSSTAAPPLAKSIFNEANGSMVDLPTVEGESASPQSPRSSLSRVTGEEYDGEAALQQEPFAIAEQLALNRQNLQTYNMDVHGHAIASDGAAVDTSELKVVPSEIPHTVDLGEDNHPLANVDLASMRGPPLKHLSKVRSAQATGGATEDGDQWETVSGDWMLILALNTTHMAHNVQAAPRASISDGLMDVLTISKPSRRTLLRMILAMETGSHMSDPDVSYIKAKALVLRPLADDDRHRLHGIDGEKCECNGLAVEVHPRLLSVFCDPDAITEAALANPHSFLSKELQKLNLQLIEEMKKEVASLPPDSDEIPSLSAGFAEQSISAVSTSSDGIASPSTDTSNDETPVPPATLVEEVKDELAHNAASIAPLETSDTPITTDDIIAAQDEFPTESSQSIFTEEKNDEKDSEE